jgi:hypothetical protein
MHKIAFSLTTGMAYMWFTRKLEYNYNVSVK